MLTELKPNLANAVAGQYELNFKKIFKESWQKVKGAKKSFWGAIGFIFLACLACLISFTIIHITSEFIGTKLGLITDAKAFTNSVMPVFGFAFNVITAVFSTTIIYMMVKHIEGSRIQAKMVFSANNVFKKLIYSALLTTLIKTIFSTGIMWAGFHPDLLFLQSSIISNEIAIKLIGFSLAILLMCYSALIIVMSLLLLVEKKLAIGTALVISTKAIMRKPFSNLWLGAFMNLFLLIGTLVTLGIGLIWLLPMSTNIYAIWYRQIFGIEANAQH